jgi:integrase
MHYFGRWGCRSEGKMVRIEGDGWEAAERLYEAQKIDLHAGRPPKITSLEELDTQAGSSAPADGSITLNDICFDFLATQQQKMETGQIGKPMFDEYKGICHILVKQFGQHRRPEDLGPRDFSALRHHLSKKWGPTRLTNAITWVKSVFNFAYDMELIDKPIRCLGHGNKTFAPPTKQQRRIEKAGKPKKELTPEQCRTLIDAAPAPLKAMILLGLNCGFGPRDCALLPRDAVDLKKRMIEFPRPKTGVERRCPLWPETVEAIKDAIAKRPRVRTEEASKLVFVTSMGRSFVGGKSDRANQVSVFIRKLMIDVGVHQQGFGAYTARHVFRTVADGSKDQPAIDFIMGHADDSMADNYRQSIDNKRLISVSDHVRLWLFRSATPKTSRKKPK